MPFLTHANRVVVASVAETDDAAGAAGGILIPFQSAGETNT